MKIFILCLGWVLQELFRVSCLTLGCKQKINNCKEIPTFSNHVQSLHSLLFHIYSEHWKYCHLHSLREANVQLFSLYQIYTSRGNWYKPRYTITTVMHSALTMIGTVSVATWRVRGTLLLARNVTMNECNDSHSWWHSWQEVKSPSLATLPLKQSQSLWEHCASLC